MENAQNQTNAKGRVVFLNALPLNALPRKSLTLDIRPLGLGELAELVSAGYEVEHFIRHVSTLQMLRNAGIPLSEPNSGNYSYRDGDLIIVVTLLSPQRGQEIQAKPEDLAVWVVRPRV